MVWWVRSDACGIFSASLTLVLLLYAQCVIVGVVLLPWYGLNVHTFLYTFCTLLAVVSHSKAQFTDPGAVPKQPCAADPQDKPPGAKECMRCKMPKPVKAHHCSICARCVIKMDHHCPWINNCVAIYNQKYFMLFLLYTCACCVYSGALLVGRFISCTRSSRMCQLSGVHAALCIITFVAAIVFGLFVGIMFDQLAVIWEQ
eukprot:g11239.t1